jgi:hypothetical protein
LGLLSLSSEQVKHLGVRPWQQISPDLELCCLRQSAIVSYAQAAVEVEVQTGRQVSAKTQQRVEARHPFEPPTSAEPVEQMSLDGGMIRLRTPLGEASEWREYKALNLGEQSQGKTARAKPPWPSSSAASMTPARGGLSGTVGI